MQTIQNTIKKAIELKNFEILKNKKRFCSLLEDLSPQLQQEISSIKKLYDDNLGRLLFQALQSDNSEKMQFLEEANLYLDEEHGIREDIRIRFISYFDSSFFKRKEEKRNIAEIREKSDEQSSAVVQVQEKIEIRENRMPNNTTKFDDVQNLDDVQDSGSPAQISGDDGQNFNDDTLLNNPADVDDDVDSDNTTNLNDVADSSHAVDLDCTTAQNDMIMSNNAAASHNDISDNSNSDVKNQAKKDLPKVDISGIINKKNLVIAASVLILILGMLFVPKLLNKPQEEASKDVQIANNEEIVELKGKTIDLHALGIDEIQSIQKEADSGDAKSQFIVGNLHLYGITYERNYEKAFFYFNKSAQQGFVKAFTKIGIMYLNGWHVEKNIKLANEQFKKAAEENDEDGLHYLALAYFSGMEYEMDYQKAIEYFNRAAELGNRNSNLFLGYCYKNGLGVEKDEAIAEKNWDIAAQAGVQESYGELLDYYLEKENYQQAYHWAKKSSESQIDSIQAKGKYRLSWFFETGIVEKQDLRMAKKLLLEAQELEGEDYSQEMSRIDDKLKDYQ